MVQPNNSEIRIFEELSKSEQGRVLIGYLQRLVSDSVDSRKIVGENKEAQLEARNMFADMVEDGIISRLKDRKTPKKEDSDDFS
jgi:hypothetical protein